MLFPVIGVRLHGWLDDLVTLTYLLGAFGLGLHGATLAIALGGATTHFVLTRLTNYPQGTWKLIPFRAHAFVELGEGVAVVAATLVLAGAQPPLARVFLFLLGLSQFTAFAFSDYRAQPRPRAPA